jgi:hypothetical protein
MKFRDYIDEAKGKGTGPEGTGGSDICVCPKCGYETEHDRGVPCNQMKCPKCGSSMTGKGTVGSEVSDSHIYESWFANELIPELQNLADDNYDIDTKKKAISALKSSKRRISPSIIKWVEDATDKEWKDFVKNWIRAK